MLVNDNLGELTFGGRVNNLDFSLSSIRAQYKGNGTTTLSNLTLATSGVERFRVDETGKIGIGTTTPSDYVSIQNAAAQPILSVSNGGTAANTPLIGVKHLGIRNAYMGIDPTSRTMFLLNYGSGTLDMTNDGNFKQTLVMTDLGNVGMGTIAPTTKLEVIGTTKTDALRVVTGAAAGSILTSDATGNATWSAAMNSTRNSAMATAQVGTQQILGELEFRYNSNAGNGNLECRSASGVTLNIESYGHEQFPLGSAPSGHVYANPTLNNNAGAFTTLPVGGAGSNEILSYKIFTTQNIYTISVANKGNTNIVVSANR
jgi:hypothetical protein